MPEYVTSIDAGVSRITVAIIVAVVAVWVLALRFAWRRQLFERFLGLGTG